MFARNSTVLTANGLVEVGKLSGTEELMGWDVPGSLRSAPISDFLVGRDAGELLSIETKDSNITLTKDHPIFMAHAAEQAHFDILLVERENIGAALGVARPFPAPAGGGCYAYKFQEGDEAECERYWLLERHTQRREASYRLQLLACRYGLPIIELCAGWQGVDRRDLERLFAEEETQTRANKLKKEFTLQEDRAHLTVRLLDEVSRLRRIFIDLLLFGSAEGHVLTVHSLAEAVRSQRGAIAPVIDQTVVQQRFPEAISYLQKNFSGGHVDVQIRAIFSGRIYSLFPTAYLRPGMHLPFISGGKPHSTIVKSITPTESRSLLYRFNAGELASAIIGGIAVGTSPWPTWQ